MKKIASRRLAGRTALALTAVALVAGSTACTNSETTTPAAAAGTGTSAAQGVGAGGRAAAEAVQADPAVQALVPEAIKQKGTLSLVTDPTYAPITFTDSTGAIVGLEPDLALAVAKKMGLKSDFSKGDFNGIIAGIQAKRYDASWAAFSITSDREAQVDMVSYMKGGTSVMVKKGNPDKIAQVMDLCGKTVAAQTGTTQALSVLPAFQKQCADAGKGTVTPLILPQQDNVNQAVSTGRAQAMAADNALVAYYAQLQPDVFTSVDSILVEPAVSGVISNKDNAGLAKAFQKAIGSLMADGSYKKILSAWGMSASEITSSEINPAQ
ncbi:MULTISPECIES: ABC transporter substrate-binding protein [Arthrobacter]|uniref:ABC transporter substrate-binding protein n=2 Tax=Arthrobacter TaxID=1663 RepID=A0ABU9KFQ7_9MICC|nr:ABC transporter substrate-binding protein [Arthrobacter sp. YJM1]MDP5225715.1 ABC transporter substrate-binding protein [Arthrobacter sp. YJM1]